MPIKKDDKGNRWVEMETLVPGTPEQVWEAIATGAGNAAWFTKATIEEHVGGTLRFDMGSDMVSSGEVTVWEPPHRFGYVETEWMPGAPAIATEVTITAHSGNKCVLRMVHSLFSSSDDWDDQMEGFEGGWPGFFAVLRIYLSRFAGMPGASVRLMRGAKGDHRELFERLMDKLNLLGANVGDRRTLPPEPEALSGVVDEVQQTQVQRYVLMVLDEPGPGIALIGTYEMQEVVTLSGVIFFYGDDAAARAAASEPRWQAWLEATFADYEQARSPCMPEVPSAAS